MSEIIQRLHSILDTTNPTILEIGSCEGEDSVKFLQIFDEINLTCFEPDPKNCNDHRARINDPRCTLIEAAICDKNGTTIFHRSGGRSRKASGSLRSPKDHLQRHPWCTFDEDIEVQCLTIDTWCEQNGIDNIDLIWADVNGAETSMINGAKYALEHTRYLYTEFGPNDCEVYEGGVTKEQVKALLPTFDEILVHSNNVLLKNMAIA